MDVPPGSKAPGLVQGLLHLRDPLGHLSRARRRYGDLFTISFPYFGRLVCVADPSLVKEVFTSKPSVVYGGEPLIPLLGPMVGPNSVLTLDEEPHMRHRKLFLPPFHGESVHRFGKLIREVAEREMESWPVGKPFPLIERTHRITLAVILRAVFGVHDESRLDRASVAISNFVRRADAILRAPQLHRNLGPWSPWTRFIRAREVLDEFVYEEIALRRAEVEAGEEGHNDVLSLLLQARHDDGSPMSDEELRDEMVTVISVGHETTATALAWTMERLLRNPRVLAKLRDSIAAGEDEYLDATLKEALRARPILAHVLRQLAAPARIGGYELPAGTVVLIAVAALHYREDLFPEPEEFRPERFLEGDVDKYAWIPFGGGTRRCLGAAFAEYEMKIILRTFVERADLSAPDQRDERVRAQHVTLTPAKGTTVSLDRPLRASTEAVLAD